jgi:hypothetical protein
LFTVNQGGIATVIVSSLVSPAERRQSRQAPSQQRMTSSVVESLAGNVEWAD